MTSVEVKWFASWVSDGLQTRAIEVMECLLWLNGYVELNRYYFVGNDDAGQGHMKLVLEFETDEDAFSFTLKYGNGSVFAREVYNNFDNTDFGDAPAMGI